MFMGAVHRLPRGAEFFLRTSLQLNRRDHLLTFASLEVALELRSSGAAAE